MVRFPQLDTNDLEGRPVALPGDLPAGPRIVVVAFQRRHTLLISGWQPTLDALAERYGATVWEVPALSRVYLPGRFYIDGGMRAGTPDPHARRHTLTAYTDLRALARELGFIGFDTIRLYLLGDGEIRWQADGEITAEKAESLDAALAALAESRG